MLAALVPMAVVLEVTSAVFAFALIAVVLAVMLAALASMAAALVVMSVVLVLMSAALPSTAALVAAKFALTSAATALVPVTKVFGTVNGPAQPALLAKTRKAVVPAYIADFLIFYLPLKKIQNSKLTPIVLIPNHLVPLV